MRILSSYETGSRVICDPPVLDTDIDWLILVSDFGEAQQHYVDAGWKNCMHTGNPYVGEGQGLYWCAYRRGKDNHIVTNDEAFYLRSVAATLLAKELNLTSKEQRIKLFRCIKFGEAYKGELP